MKLVIFNKKKTTNLKISRLVYKTFIGKIPKGYVVDHIDGNKRNDQITNLQLISPSENTKRSFDMSTGARLSSISDHVDPYKIGLIKYLVYHNKLLIA